MKIFRSVSKKDNSYYFSTNFYHKDKQTEQEFKKLCYIQFQRDTLPLMDDSNCADFELKAIVDGEEYDVILDCYQDRNGEVQPKLFLGKFQKKNTKDNNSYTPSVTPTYEEEPLDLVRDTSGQYSGNDNLQIEPDDLPFY